MQSASYSHKAPYIVLFDLKPLIKDGNLQVYMYCVHARKRASGAPRTHFRACKISTYPGGMSSDPPHNPFSGAPLFVFALPPPPPPQSSRQPCWELPTTPKGGSAWDVLGTPSLFSGTWDSPIRNGKAVCVSGHE